MRKLVTLSAVVALLGTSAAFAQPFYDGSYGDCVSSYNAGDRNLHGTPGQNTFAQNGQVLSPSEVAKLRNEVRKQYCSGLKGNKQH